MLIWVSHSLGNHGFILDQFFVKVMLILTYLTILPLLSRLSDLVLPFGQGSTKVLMPLGFFPNEAVIAILHGDSSFLPES